MLEPKIYIACLAAYNNGKLHGRWIDANQDLDDLNEEISNILKESPEENAEEWAIHDYEDFGDISLSEYSDLRKVSILAQLLSEHGESFGAWYYCQDGHYFELDELKEKYEVQMQGEYDSKEDFAYELLESTGSLCGLSDSLKNYFDYQSYARDLEYGGDYTFVQNNSKTLVFCNL